AFEAGKTNLFVFEGNPISADTSFIPSFLGGAVFAMASHGSDQLIVQRLLSCRSKLEAQKALIASGVVVFVQFAIFLAVGLALWAYYDHALPADLGLTRDDEIFPHFIIDGLPTGISGLLLAGILAAAMSTLSSSLSALSSSTVNDVYARLKRTPMTDEQGFKVGRWATIGWGIAFILPATVFESDSGNIVILALGIAGITYGGLLGAFVFGIVNKRARAADANIAFAIAVAVNAFFFAMENYVTGEVWVAWQWYPLLGVIVTFAVGGLLSLRHPAADPVAEADGSKRCSLRPSPTRRSPSRPRTGPGCRRPSSATRPAPVSTSSTRSGCSRSSTPKIVPSSMRSPPPCRSWPSSSTSPPSAC